MTMGVGRLCRMGGKVFKKFLGKVGASSVFDSITITEFVNQNLLFSFSSYFLTSDVARIFLWSINTFSMHTSIEFLRKNYVI